jgi:hypothetical protein
MKTNKTNTTHAANETLKAGTPVVSKTDGEPGTVERVLTRGRNGRPWSYLVRTRDGIEVWHRADLFQPESH